MTGNRRRPQVFMPAPGWWERSWGLRGGIGEEAVEQRGGKPARKKDGDPHSPARSLSLFYFIKYFSFFLSFLPSRVIHKSSWSFVSAIRRKEAQIMVTSLISWPRLITHITQFVTYCAVSGIQRLIFFFLNTTPLWWHYSPGKQA